jgi:hypothetical protein
MKKLLSIISVIFLLSEISYAEIIKINCTVKFENGQEISNYFELNSETDIYYNEFSGDQIFWTSVTETSNNQWMPIYHHTNRRSGVYTAGFGINTSIFPEKGDPMVKLIAERIGSCEKSDSKLKF